jgi:prepilin-type N-terminal cleavage/methylation domain-containing protein
MPAARINSPQEGLRMETWRGYTLIETLMVLAMLAIVATASIPAFSGLVDRQRLRAAATAVHDVFHSARAESLRRSAAISVAVNADENRWCLALSDGGACDCLQPGACRLGEHEAPVISSERFPGVSLSSNFPAGAAAFHPPRGTGTPGTAQLRNRAGRAELVVSSLGRIRSCASPAFARPPC